MKKQRPAIVSTIAIFNIIFSIGWGLFYCCGGGGMIVLISVFSSLPPEDAKKGEIQFLKELARSGVEHVPYITTYITLIFVVGAILSLLLLISGMGLLAMKEWARKLAIYYALFSISFIVFDIIYTITVLQPNAVAMMTEMKEWSEKTPDLPPNIKDLFTQPVHEPTIVDMLGTVFTGGLEMVYAFVVLILLSLPTTKRAFSSTDSPVSESSHTTDADDDFGDFDRDRERDQFS